MTNDTLVKKLFSFPNPVNEYSARMVGFGAFCLSVAYVLTGNIWVLVVLTYGFWARVLTGPTLSPLGQFATRVFAPLFAKIVKPKFCPGPPKRFAQSIGTFVSTSALFAYFIADSVDISKYFVGAILVAAFLEAFLGFCIGCAIFGRLMKAGIIPEEVCDRCINYRKRS